MRWNVKLKDLTIKDLMLILLVACLAIIGLLKLDVLSLILHMMIEVIKPFVLGIVFAFLLNLPMEMIQKKIGHHRVLSLLISLIAVFGLLGFLVVIISPQIVQNIRSLVDTFPTDLNSVELMVKDVMTYLQIESDVQAEIIENISVYFSNVGDYLVSRLPDALESVKNFFSHLTTLGLGFIISIYLVIAKEGVLRQLNLLLEAMFNEKVVENLKSLGKLVNHTFTNFVSGQMMEALIIGVLCYIGCLIFGFPNAAINGVMIGITNIIPIFGPIIGTFICALLMFFSSPIQAILFVIFGTCLQQFESHLIYPQVVGTSVGLPPLYVMFAVTISGGLFGLVGMIVGLPVFSVLYALTRQWVHQRIDKKNKKKKTEANES